MIIKSIKEFMLNKIYDNITEIIILIVGNVGTL